MTNAIKPLDTTLSSNALQTLARFTGVDTKFPKLMELPTLDHKQKIKLIAAMRKLGYTHAEIGPFTRAIRNPETTRLS